MNAKIRMAFELFMVYKLEYYVNQHKANKEAEEAKNHSLLSDTLLSAKSKAYYKKKAKNYKYFNDVKYKYATATAM